MQSALVDLAGVVGAVCLVNGGRLVSAALGWALAGVFLLAFWVAVVILPRFR